MNEFKQKAINRYIDMNKLFLYLLKEGNFDSDKISLMKQNHDSMRSALIDLGVKFTEIDTIKELNLRIRNMESSNNSINLDYQKVSLYINSINKKINNSLEDHGVYCIVNTSFAPNISVSISILPSDDKERPDYYKDEEAYKKGLCKQQERHSKFIKNFVLLEKSNNSSLEMAFDQKNIDLLTKIVEDCLEQKCSQVSYELTSRHFKNDLSEKMLHPSLRKFDLTFLTLPSHQSFAASLARRYG